MNSNHDNIKESLLKQRLLDYRFLDQKIKNLEYQIANIDYLNNNIKSYYVKENGDKEVSKADLINIMHTEKKKEEKEKELIERNLKHLNQLEREVIEAYYFQVNKPTWDAVGCKLHVSPSWAKINRNRAITKLSKLLY